jgi:MFS family permease
VVGPLAAKGIVAASSMRTAFFVAGLLALSSSALVFFRLDRDVPEMDASHDGESSARAAVLLMRIKTSAFATFAYGYFQASVVLFLPLFLIEKKGIAESQTILIPAFFATGMLLVASHAGRLGDRFGHLHVMRILGAIGATMVACFVWLTSFPLMCAAIFVAGATLASISPLSLALQGKIVAVKDLARSNSIYNFFYAAGMLMGPPVSSAVYVRFGGGAMLGQLAALWAAFVAFTIVFYKDDPHAAPLVAGRSFPSEGKSTASPGK